MSVTVRVPAKVNLHLQVLPRRTDGFHELVTVFQAVSIYDEVMASPTTGLSVAVDDDTVPTDAGNLAWQAATLLATRTGVQPDVHLDIRKSIPVAGGMAGGSADAAAALVACAQLWGVTADLAALAAELGSDVAFPLVGGTALGTGRGERLVPVESATLHWVFAFADFGISAGSAYAEFDRQRPAASAEPMAPSPYELVEALARGDVDRVGSRLANDLQSAAVALAPSLSATLAVGVDAGSVGGIVSGSGPTCAFLCRSAEHASVVASRLPGRTALAVGPVAGAVVID